MKVDMKKDTRISLIFLVLGVVALVTFFLTFFLTPTPPFELRPFPGRFPWDIELFYTIKTVVSTLNAAILLILLVTYIRIYNSTKSEFTIGLMIFSLVLFLNTIASNPMLIQVFGFRPFGLGPFAMLPDMFVFFALVVLLYLTLKY